MTEKTEVLLRPNIKTIHFNQILLRFPEKDILTFFENTVTQSNNSINSLMNVWMNGWIALFSWSKLNLALSSHLLRSGRIQFQSFLARISIPSSGFKNNLGGLYGAPKGGITPWCSFLQLSILCVMLLGKQPSTICRRWAQRRSPDSPLHSTQVQPQHQCLLQKPQCPQQASTILSQTLACIWCFVNLGHRSLPLTETYKILPNPVSVRKKGNSSFDFWMNPF